jgi:NADP-dependent 3-hydroxy acid dehydrogenase YdfG
MAGLEGNFALVTGAGGGIGQALARALAEEGAELWLVGRRRKLLEETAHACGGARVHVCPTDLTKTDEVTALSHEVSRECGRVDVLVHSAGVIGHGMIDDTEVDSLDEQYQANVRGPYLLTQQLLPLLRIGPGQIVFVNSSVVARAGASQFAATQHALRAVADSLRQEVNGEGIRVLNIFPGRTATSRQERLYAEESKPYRPELLLQPGEIATMAVAALKLPRTAEVTEIHIRPMLKSY